MAIVIIRQDHKIELWKKALLKADSSLEVYSFLEEHPKDEITMAITWKHPSGSLSGYPNLKCIASAGAGVDYLFEDATRPNDIPITRIVDPFLASDMSEHVLAVILAHLKNLNAYKAKQIANVWEPMEYLRIKDVTIGILGLGELGALTGTDLTTYGFKVQGWSRSAKNIDNVATFSGPDSLSKFLESTDVLVCLLPLTPATEGILNKKLLSQLPKNAFVINVARGGHMVDEDLLELIDNGHLSGACLDVYHTEPLPTSHPFWNHNKIHMTPHYASVSDTNSVIPQLVENYKRLQSGEELQNKVDMNKGY
ncbi:2-hydroxyacid dehydrogenase [Maribacter arcticus]|mgnify:FL=1|uniref:Glyoxylate/hydroxypyruvate reductase A n=2 Tax=Maribacter arcticus TaxID=561365 RepID=A0A1T5D010_9FLAO|nr:glyoxylate/hydroxypyruvate reductase A [Maribacter arcticus]SKB65078.1 glyoxylate/hydroxypyruvate reductase A [Maribacter arcticus]|tara:strand:+ start:658 stop:1587 length:930 start_codon:yes stop_codon:yes gene_type:complete